MNYIEFFKKYSYSSLILELGNMNVPDYLGVAPAEMDYPLPPILLPILSVSSWPGYIGILMNPFSKNLEFSYVDYFVEDNQIVEIAKNMDQFKTWIMYDLYMNVANVKSAELFSETINYCKADDLERRFENFESESDLANLDIFRKDLPAVLKSREGAPDWVTGSMTIDEINQLITDCDLEQAWYALNSNNFYQSDTLKALKRISSRLTENKEMFDDLISCWEEANHLMWN